MQGVREDANLPRVRYANNARVAHAVQEYLSQQEGVRVTARPFNRFDVEFTDWWLVPTTEWPAFKYGKWCFHRRDDLLYAGYYIEKGLGPRLKGFPDVSPKHIMEEDWRWHDFVRWAQAGKVDDVIADIIARTGAPVRLRVEAYAFNRVPDPEKGSGEPVDLMEWEVAALNAALTLVRPAQGPLAKVNAVESVAALAQHIRGDAELDFFWIGWVTGIRLQYGDDTDQGWDAPTLWARALSVWTRFVV